jgi:acetyl-CoA C-acetyltransferase
LINRLGTRDEFADQCQGSIISRRIMMRDAVIVSTARTPLPKKLARCGFNMTRMAQRLAAMAVKAAVERAGVAPDEVEDVIYGLCKPRGCNRRKHRKTGRTACGINL